MSKFFTVLFLLLILGGVGGFIALGFMDVPVSQETVTIETNLHEIRGLDD